MVRFCLMQKYILWSIHPIASSNSFVLDEGRLAIQSLKGSLAVPVIALVEAIWGLVGNEMAHVPTITSLSTQRRVGVYTNLNLD